MNIKISGDNLLVEGWGTIPYTQHFNGSKTHSYALEVKSKIHNFEEIGQVTNHDLTKQMAYDGHKRCANGVMNSLACNFDHKNVGFQFKIPLNKLIPGHDYKLYLKMHAKQSGKKYRIPLFYTTKNHLYLDKGRREYIVQSDFKHVRFSIYGHTLFAKQGPSPHTDLIYSGKSCSETYTNTWYFKQNAVFNHIYDIKRYNNQITYFKVKATPSNCYDSRLRIVESTHKDAKYVYVPSTHVNYIGNPTTIRVQNKTFIPDIYVKDTVIEQYSDYDPYRYATASDRYDGDLTDKINIVRTNVNTKIPGSYETCYSVTNSSKLAAYGCGSVFVKEIPSKKRFVSEFTIHDTKLRRWNRKDLKNKLKSKTSIKKETIRP